MSRKKLTIIIVIIAAAAAAVIAGFFLYMNMGSKYNDVLYPNTFVNNVDVSELTPQEAEKKVLAQYDKYKLDITFRGGETESLEGSEFGYTYKLTDSFAKFLENQEILSWLPEQSKDHVYEVGVTVDYDEETLKKIIDTFPELQERNMEQPTDAYLDYVDNQYTVVPSTEGTALDTDRVEETILLAVQDAEHTVEIEGPDYYKEPAVRTDDTLLNAQAEQLNTYANADIKYILPEGKEPAELTREMLKDWLKQDDAGNYIRDDAEYEDHLATFISEMSSKLKSDENTQSFDTTLDGTIEVELNEYSTFSGYQIDIAAEMEQLKNDIASNQFIERAPIYSSEGNGNANHGIGDTYAEVNLTRQYVWYYEKGELKFEADIVSGTMTTWRYTPEGIYTLSIKESPHIMKGEINPSTGKPIYEAPCTYWMNIIPSLGIGFHDYDSRGDWSKDAYLYNGSHGCINMHGYDAEELFSLIQVGTPVVMYYTEPLNLRYEGGPSTWDPPADPTPAEETPAEEPTPEPTEVPTEEPTEAPTEEPTEVPTEEPTPEPTEVPTEEPAPEPTEAPDDGGSEDPGESGQEE